MGVLDVELSDRLIEDIKDLAARHFGDASDDSIRQVVETALEMRLLWLERVDRAGAEVEEPASHWESGGTPAEGDVGLRDWLFERRRGR